MASTAATLGEMRIACLRNCTSGSVYSCEASETSSTAWADDSADSVASALDESSPPTPGRVDELQPALEDLARQQHLGRDDPALVAGVAPLRHVIRQLVERHLLTFH